MLGQREKLVLPDGDKKIIAALLLRALLQVLFESFAWVFTELYHLLRAIAAKVVAGYREKMTFDGFLFRTSRINEVARMIYSLDEDYSENKNRSNRNNSNLSCQVVLPVQFSNLFLMDLKRLACILA